MKDSFYLKHDLDSREDEQMRALLMRLGAKGYGIFWMLAEDLHHNNGRLKRDFDALAWTFREPVSDIKAVVDDFGLFYEDEGQIASHRIDRERQERQAAASEGRSAIMRRKRPDGSPWVKDRDLEGTNEPPSTRRGEDRKGQEITTGSPSAVDLSDYRLPKNFGRYGGVYVVNLSKDDAESCLRDMRPGPKVKAALEWRIAVIVAERDGKERGGGVKSAAEIIAEKK